MTDRGMLITVSGPSGSGKGTVLNELIKKRDDVKISVSMTTRQKRNGEIDGTSYYFVSKEYFEKKINANGMLEYAEYAGNYYGTPKEPVDDMLQAGKAVILEIDVQGADKIKEIYPDVIRIFIMPPSVSVLERRLRGRNTEDEETINHRLVIAKGEMRMACDYDFIVVNDALDEAVKDIETIIDAERLKASRNKKILSEVINYV